MTNKRFRTWHRARHDRWIKIISVDLFCGAGGVSKGIEDARNRHGRKIARVCACINHDAVAISSHAANHPDALHFVEDIKTLDLTDLVRHVAQTRIRYPKAKLLLHASLECTNFSNAKGGQSREVDSRTLADHMPRYITALDPDLFTIENVREFMAWGPLVIKTVNKSGQPDHCPLRITKSKSGSGYEIGPVWIPESRTRGKDYVRWVKEVSALGYRYDWKLLDAANYGAHTSRTRLFGVFYREHDQAPAWPKPTHNKVRPGAMFPPDQLPWRPVAEVLDLDQHGASIFNRKVPLSRNTILRIRAGLEKFGNREQFMSKSYGPRDGSFSNGYADLQQPSPTITTSPQLGLVTTERFLKTYYGKGGFSSVDQPAPTLRTKDTCALVELVSSKFMLDGNGYGNSPRSLRLPAPTLLASRRNHVVVTSQWIDRQYSRSHNHSGLDQPCGTLTTSPKAALATATQFLFNPQYSSQGRGIDRPCVTLIARMDKKPPSLVTVLANSERRELVAQTPEEEDLLEYMYRHGINDILFRMLFVPELADITGFGRDYIFHGSNEVKKKHIGNAVPPLVIRRWIEAMYSK